MYTHIDRYNFICVYTLNKTGLLCIYCSAICFLYLTIYTLGVCHIGSYDSLLFFLESRTPGTSPQRALSLSKHEGWGHMSRSRSSRALCVCLRCCLSVIGHFSSWRAVFLFKKAYPGFPGGAVVENLPANAGDTGSSPGLGRSHVPRSNWAREPQLLSLRVWSLCSATREAAIVRGPRTAMKSGPHLPQLEKALAQKRRPNTAKK